MSANLFILMIEDDPDDRYITETTFAESGFDIRLEYLEQPDGLIPYLDHCKEAGHLPSLLIIDKELPGIDGLEVLTQLKTHPDFRFIPAVVISGAAYPKVVEESYKLGANSFMEKPDSGRLTRDRIEIFIRYWFGIVDLPDTKTKPDNPFSIAGRKRYITQI